MKILIVEDNPVLRENLVFLLTKCSFLCESASNWKVAIDKVMKTDYDIIILDINMPIMNGKEFLWLRPIKAKSTLVIALTSDSMLQDKLTMFELWVDDYVTKPFEIEELVVRIKSLLKRSDKVIDDEKHIWNITLNYSKKKISINSVEIKFPQKQYLIIEYLVKNIWYPINKIKIMEYVWWEQEENLEFNSTTLESHIYAIRKKLWKDFIKTIKWIWYIVE